jgi:hypothetical protein
MQVITTKGIVCACMHETAWISECNSWLQLGFVCLLMLVNIFELEYLTSAFCSYDFELWIVKPLGNLCISFSYLADFCILSQYKSIWKWNKFNFLYKIMWRWNPCLILSLKLTIFVKHFHLISGSFCITYILARR